MNDAGVQSYNIQATPPVESFAETVSQEALKKIEDAKKSIQAPDDEMKQPLLFEDQ